MEDLFKCSKYRDFLRRCFPGKGDKRGRRRDLAKALSCQTSFISLVLTDRAHFNEDMLFKSAQFLRLNSKETEFFLVLYHLERAGSSVLRSYYQSKIKEALEARSQVKERVGPTPSIPSEIQAEYYSNWTYAAIHTVVMNPETRDIASIAKKLNLGTAIVKENIEFLEKWHFLNRIGTQYEPGMNRVHLSADSPFIIQHHRNWHLEAMRAVGEKNDLNLNYSGALSMSKADAETIKEILLSAIGTIEKQIAPSKDEDTVGLSISFFRY